MNYGSQYRVVKVSKTTVWIEDMNLGALSVTNDAERVCKELNDPLLYPGRRIVYKDSEGNWDELMHVDGVFVDFGPADPPD